MKIMLGLIFLFTTVANASIEKYSLGLGAGISHPFGEENFKDNASSGNSYYEWLGYRFSPSFCLELAHEALDFDQLNASSKAINLSAVFNLKPYSEIYPFLKLGVGAVEHTFHITAFTKKNGVALKAAIGLNFNMLL